MRASQDISTEGRGSERFTFALLICWIVVVSASHLAWLVQDQDIMAGTDPYNYLSQVVFFLDEGRKTHPEGLWGAVEAMSLGGRPPLYQLLATPFVLVFGPSVDAALGLNLAFGALLMLATYGIARRIATPRVALLAAVLVSAYPPLIHLSRVFRPHYALPACVALSLWLLLALLRSRSLLAAWAFGLSLAFGLLIHPVFAFVLAIPAFLGGLWLVFLDREPRWPERIAAIPSWLGQKLADRLVFAGLLPGAAISVLALLWYSGRAESFASISETWRGLHPKGLTHGFDELEHSFWWYALTAPGAMTNVLALAALVALLYALVRGGVELRLLAVAVLCGYGLLAQQATLAWWYLAPILPIVAVLTAVWIGRLRPPVLSRSLGTVCATVAIFVFAFSSWNLGDGSRKVALALGSPLETSTCNHRLAVAFCSETPKKAGWPIADILRAVEAGPSCEGSCRMIVHKRYVAAFRYQQLVAGSESDLILQQVDFRVPRVGMPSVPRLLRGDYFLRINAKKLVSQLLDRTQESLESVYHVVETYEVPDGRWQLIRRVAPLEDDMLKAPRAVLLGNMYQRMGRMQDAADLYEKILKSRPKQIDARIGKARLHENQGRTDLAVAELTWLLEHMPDDPRLLRGLALIYRSAGDKPRARETLERVAVSGTPEDLLRLATWYVEDGDVELAVELLRQALRQSPGDIRVRRRLANTYRKLANHDAAIREYGQILQLDPGLVPVRIELGATYRDAERMEDAIRELTLAAEQAPNNVRPRRLLARIYRSRGEPGRAATLIEEIRAIGLAHAAADQDP